MAKLNINKDVPDELIATLDFWREHEAPIGVRGTSHTMAIQYILSHFFLTEDIRAKQQLCSDISEKSSDSSSASTSS